MEDSHKERAEAEGFPAQLRAKLLHWTGPRRNLGCCESVGLLLSGLVFQNLGVSENGGTLFGGPNNKDPTIWGTILGSPIFGNSHLLQHWAQACYSGDARRRQRSGKEANRQTWTQTKASLDVLRQKDDMPNFIMGLWGLFHTPAMLRA